MFQALEIEPGALADKVAEEVGTLAASESRPAPHPPLTAN